MSFFSQQLLDLHDEITVDLFAGGGGASLGFEMATGRQVDIAINHDAAAVEMHRINHPQTDHHVSDVFEVDPRVATGGRPVGFLWASPDCFVAGTLILTREGYLPIEQIAVGDEVFTHQKRWRRVTSVMASNKWVVKVTGHGHPGLIVSEEHPFYIRNQCNKWNNAHRAYDRKLEPAQWLKPGEWKRGPAPMNAAGGERSYWASPAEFPESQVPPVGGRGLSSDDRLLWLAGRYLGDGWTRLTADRAELVIICGRHEADVLGERLHNMWPREGARSGHDELAWHRRNLDTAVQFSTNHRGLVTWLREHFGHGASEKIVPGWVYGLPIGHRVSLLDGYCSADGHDAGTWTSAQTVSKALAYGIRTLATTLGKVVTVHLASPQNDVIEGRKVKVRQAWIVKWRHATARETTAMEDGFRWSPVKSLDSQGHATVYNLSVEEDESYVAEGIVVHNCTYHSKARGCKPIRSKLRKRRALAWVVTRWAGQVRPRVIMLENVEEFADWGPLVGPPDQLRPCPKRRGKSFRKWVRSLTRLGYAVEWRELRACDYGAPTIRKRLFLIARCDGQPIVWPEATHGPGRKKPYRTAAECIDWSIPMLSIFATKEEAKAWGKFYGQASPIRPLADNTQRRIARGVKRYVLDNPKPFLVTLAHGEVAPNGSRRWGKSDRGTDEPFTTVACSNDTGVVAPHITKFRSGAVGHSIDDPLHTVTANSNDANHLGGSAPIGVVAPYLVPRYGEREGQEPRSRSVEQPSPAIVPDGNGGSLAAVHLSTYYGGESGNARAAGIDEPSRSQTADGNRHALVASFLAQNNAASARELGRPLDDPLATVAANGSGHHGLTAVSLIEQHGTAHGEDVAKPLQTVSAGGQHHGLVAAHMTHNNTGYKPDSAADDPLHTIVADGARHNVVATHIQRDFGQSVGSATGEPIGTVTPNGQGKAALVASFLAKFYGTGTGQMPSEPLHTIPTLDRFGFVTVTLGGETYVLEDIAMRMLQPKELYAAQGFHTGYIIDRGADGRKLTKTEQVRMVGNSVCPPIAAALIKANCAELIARKELIA